ncbi:MAG: DUF2147 domain-containing protein [Ferruginibacter sp.]|nr:DUF2147 domain-containing protein [Ferruginibacter sp.]
MDAIKTISINLWQRSIAGLHKKKVFLTGCLYFFTTFSFAQTNLYGKWVDADHKEKRVEMYAGSNQKIYGKSDKGVIVFKDFIYDAKTETYKGILINPDDGQEFAIAIKQSSSNNFTFAVKKFIFRKTFVFERRSVNQ